MLGFFALRQNGRLVTLEGARRTAEVDAAASASFRIWAHRFTSTRFSLSTLQVRVLNTGSHEATNVRARVETESTIEDAECANVAPDHTYALPFTTSLVNPPLDVTLEWNDGRAERQRVNVTINHVEVTQHQ